MKKHYRLNNLMKHLLIEEAMDEFTVTELRDVAHNKFEQKQTPVELRVKLYRHLLALEEKGLLSTKGTGRNKKYAKTNLFIECFSKSLHDASEASFEKIQSLKKERNSIQGELEITLGEVEHYENFIKRFPDNRVVITTLKDKAKGQAASLLGRINATSKLISVLEGSSTC
ncbi:hypothetical protein [Psychrosphaera algicola]|uniref:Transcriptional regulator VspR n=1 Tax=Psychrosphaera algicola TaxID=3023714 RepID=A0ABT5FFS2_9GAMM|nr:hypothetical protein [Psychrosphaera sp. G1-22]MDC2890363.1 hypothetical protein [Psychrosphaera sp. G1-22]